MRAVYPGSFNPPTVGHIEIVNSAINRFKGLRRSIELTVGTPNITTYGHNYSEPPLVLYDLAAEPPCTSR